MRTKNVFSFVRRGLNDQGGQVLPWVTMMLFALLGMAGLSIDVGQAYVAKSQLQASSNAAALSAALKVYNNGANDSPTYWATQYSSASPTKSSTGGLNANASLGSVAAPSISTPCLNFLSAAKTCVNDSLGNSVPLSRANAVKVTQSATVNTTFMRIFGINSLTVKSTGTAALGAAKPWNVAIILDATPSMSATDTYCTPNNISSETCALNGIQILLGGGTAATAGSGSGVPPCKGNLTSCASNTPDALFRVSLFTFPNVTTATVDRDYAVGCTSTSNSTTQPVVAPYTFPDSASGSTAGFKSITYTGTTAYSATYQITPPNLGGADANGFTSDYYDYSATDHLNTGSYLVRAIGNSSTKGCLKPPQGWGQTNQTYFASAIYAAQQALNAEKAAVDTLLGSQISRNAIIFISDGQANAPHTSKSGGEVRFPYNSSTASTGGLSVTSDGSSTTNLVGKANSFGKYPDFNDNCQQAIQAAMDAKNQGTRFYAVAYGSEVAGCLPASSGDWGTDSSLVTITQTGTYPLNIPSYTLSQIVPCLVMQEMASPGDVDDASWYFYTDGKSISNGCVDQGHKATSLSSIFPSIGATFVQPRLISNDVN